MAQILQIENCYHEFTDWDQDCELVAGVKRCIEVQRRIAQRTYELTFVANTTSGTAVAEETLREILSCGRNVNGIATQPEISNVIAFNKKHVEGNVASKEVAELRARVDALVRQRVSKLFEGQNIVVQNSGHFWYPPGGYMGWHTNSYNPGWRLYLTYAEEPGKSFFRYRHPDTGEIVTSMDGQWDVRMFRVTRENPFWHAVYSETHRFSLGFVIRPRSVANSAVSHAKELLKTLGVHKLMRRRVRTPSSQPSETSIAAMSGKSREDQS